MLFLLNILRIIVQETICMCVTISIIEIKHSNPGKNVIHVEDIGKGKEKKRREIYIIPRRLSHSISFHYFILLRQIGNERRREGKKKSRNSSSLNLLRKKNAIRLHLIATTLLLLLLLLFLVLLFSSLPLA